MSRHGGPRPNSGRPANNQTAAPRWFIVCPSRTEVDAIDAALTAQAGPGTRREQLLRLLKMSAP